MNKYSLKIGAWKGLVSALIILAAIVTFFGFSDMTIVSIIETYIFPVLGSMTVGGLLTMALNYAKIKTKVQ